MAGPDVPVGGVCNTPVSLLDAYQTVVHGTGFDETKAETSLTDRSWFDIANDQDDPDRLIF